MKKILLLTLFMSLYVSLFAQNTGDTIKVKTFHYGSNTRDTFAIFPDNNLSYEKIILKYNMRCKNALVSNSTNRDQGCGEWDYSCNTYLVDSSKVEEALSTQPSYVITNFSGNTFKYALQPAYDYLVFNQQKLIIDSTISESIVHLGSGQKSSSQILDLNRHSGKLQLLIPASDLLNAGLSAGALNGLVLHAIGNSANAGFMKIKLKHDSIGQFNLQSPQLDGFTEVYHLNTTWVQGANYFHFTTPFNWDGLKNIIVEISFTNTQVSGELNLLADSVASNLQISTYDNYALDLKNQGFARLDASNLASINKEISIQFWAYGDARLMPASTTILYGYANNAGDRQLNIHLPHSSNNVYFDCGFSGSYDRINKLALLEEQGGRWNHWTFTKNANTGSMKIYLNGNLWFSGTGKTKAISILNLLLGKDPNGGSNYKGKINGLQIWDKELPDSVINAWMIRKPNADHPFYQNLLSYYPMNEGNDNQIKNQVTGIQVSGENFQWTFDRGESLSRGFEFVSYRPKLSFIKGDYVSSIQNFLAKDSLAQSPVYIQKYRIISRANQVPLASDEVKLDTTYTQFYPAYYSRIFDGNSGELLDSTALIAHEVLNITSLNYYKRYPFYNELMSFVTPYGIGLNLGPNGKSWYFDVTDFAPLLKGKKRILMTLGGQNQEQMDLEFWFVVGTPPRPVLQFNQIWQGTNRTGAAGIAAINNNSRYAAVNVPTLATGKYFKIKSSITGHGAEGEFEANGGIINHMLNINGGDTDFVWRIYQNCSRNPVFPQGGTWVYDREGWCPGQRSLLKEFNITPMVQAGSDFSIDYACSNPPKIGGDYRYHVVHQLVTYGDPSFKLDARIYDILQPSDKVLYARLNPACSQPQIVIQNTGTDVITSMEINYWVNNGTKQTYKWTGSLQFLDTQSIFLPVGSLWIGNVQSSGNKFYAEIKSVNNQSDQYVFNNKMESAFNRPEVIPGKFTIEFFTNNNPGENSFQLVDESGNLIDSKSFKNPNTMHTYSYELNGCFRLMVKDTGTDGLQWWANSSQGTGFVRFKNASGTIVKSLQADFGSEIEYAFTTNWLLSENESVNDMHISIYPNPAHAEFVLDGDDLVGANIQFIDVLGNQVNPILTRTGSKIMVDVAGLSPAVYLVMISNNGKKLTRSIVVY